MTKNKYPWKGMLLFFIIIHFAGCVAETYPYAIVQIDEIDLGSDNTTEIVTSGWTDGIGDDSLGYVAIYSTELDELINITGPPGVSGSQVRTTAYNELQDNFLYVGYSQDFTKVTILPNTTVIRRFKYNSTTHNLTLNLTYVFPGDFNLVDILVDDFNNDSFPEVLVAHMNNFGVFNGSLSLLTINSTLDNFTLADEIIFPDNITAQMIKADFLGTGEEWIYVMGVTENTTLAMFFSINNSLKLVRERTANLTLPGVLGQANDFAIGNLDDDQELEIIVVGLNFDSVALEFTRGFFQLIDFNNTIPFFKQTELNITLLGDENQTTIFDSIDIEDIDNDSILDIIIGGAISNRSHNGIWRHWHEFSFGPGAVQPFIKAYGMLRGLMVEDRDQWMLLFNNTDNRTVFSLELVDSNNDFRKEAVIGLGTMDNLTIQGIVIEGFKQPRIVGIDDFYWPFIYPANYTLDTFIIVNNSLVQFSFGDSNRTVIHSTQANFSEGTFINTSFNASGFVQLDFGTTSGLFLNTFTADIMSEWISFGWNESVPYGEELLNNRTTSNVKGEIDMATNVLLFHMNNDSAFGENNTVAFDFSYSENNGTIINDPILIEGELLNNSWDFTPGQSEYILVQDAVSLNITENISISAWIFPDILTGQRGIVAKIDTLPPGDCGYSFIQQGNSIEFEIGDGSTDNTLDSGNILGGFNDEWHHVAATYNRSNGEQIIYHNGDRVINTTIIPAINICNTSNNLTVGAEQVGVSITNFFSGHLDEVAIWNKTLTASDIRNIYERAAANLTFKIRTRFNGGNWSNFTGPGGDNTSFTQPRNTITGFTDQTQLQYNATFTQTDIAINTAFPKLESVQANFTINVEDVTADITPVNAFEYDLNLSEFIANDFTPNDTSITYILSPNKSITWLYWNDSWKNASGFFEQSNTKEEINDHISMFPFPGNLTFRAFLFTPNSSETPSLDYIYVAEGEFFPPTPAGITIFQDANFSINGTNATFFENETIYWIFNLTNDPLVEEREWPDANLFANIYCEVFGENEAEILWFTLPFENQVWSMLYKGGIRVPHISDDNCTLILDIFNRTLTDRFRGIVNGSFSIRFDDLIWPELTLLSISTNTSRSWLGTGDLITYNVSLTETNSKAGTTHCNVTDPLGTIVVNNTALNNEFNNTSVIGTYTLTCTSEDEKEHITTESWEFELFDSFCGPPVEYERLRLVYNPYSRVGESNIIFAYYSDGNTPIRCGNVSFNWNGQSFQMSYLHTYEAYVISFTPEQLGNETFNITADWNGSAQITGYGLIKVKDPFTVRISLWQRPGDVTRKVLDKTMDTPFLDEWGWVYVLNSTLKCEPMAGSRVYNENFGLGKFWTDDSNLGGEGCYFHGEYVDGTAEIEVWEEGFYQIWFIDKDIDWLDDFSAPIADGSDVFPLDPQNLYYQVGRKLDFVRLNREGLVFNFDLLESSQGLDIWTKLASTELDETKGELNYWVSHEELNWGGWVWAKILALSGFAIIILVIFGLVWFAEMPIKQAVSLGLVLGGMLGVFVVTVGW